MSKRKARRYVDRRANAGNGGAAGHSISGRLRSSRFDSVAGFVLSCICLYGIITVLPDSWTRLINEHTAVTLGLVLNFFGVHATTVGDIVSENGVAFRVIPECTPIFTAGLLASFVAFHPASLRQKATGLTLGIPALYLGNLVRLALTFMVSRYDRRFFEIFHVYLGQVFTLVLVILCCFLWMRWVEREEGEQDTVMDTAGFLARFGLISAGLFLVWLKVHHGYIRLLDWFMLFGFSLFGRPAGLAQETPVYYETFSIVIVVSLILAVRSIPWRRRARMLGAGLGLLFLIHLLHRIDNALMVLYNITAMRRVDLTLLVIGQYMVPVLVLIWLVRMQKKEVRPVLS